MTNSVITPEVAARMGEAEFLAALDNSERTLNKIYYQQLILLRETENRGLANSKGYHSTASMVREMWRTSLAELRRRIAHAELLLGKQNLLGEQQEPELPNLGTALSEGAVNPEHAEAVRTEIDKFPAHATPGDRAAADEILTNAARDHEPYVVRQLGREIRFRLDQDGPEPKEDPEPNHTRNTLRIRPRRDGGAHFDGTLNAEGHALLKNLLSPRTAKHKRPGNNDDGPTHAAPPSGGDSLANNPSPEPRQPGGGPFAIHGSDSATTNVETQMPEPVTDRRDSSASATSDDPTVRKPATGDQTGPEPPNNDGPALASPVTGEPRDLRVIEQRQGDALVEILRAAASYEEGPRESGEPVNLTITMRLEDLQRGLHQQLIDGVALGPATIRRMACDSNVIPVVLGSRGEVLDIGRKTRVIPIALRRALAVRDGGCSWPGCGTRPQRCRVHHVLEWSRNGPTSLDNCCLLCPYHHDLIHASEWEMRIRNGIPEFTPPFHVDPERRPRANILHRPFSPIPRSRNARGDTTPRPRDHIATPLRDRATHSKPRPSWPHPARYRQSSPRTTTADRPTATASTTTTTATSTPTPAPTSGRTPTD